MASSGGLLLPFLFLCGVIHLTASAPAPDAAEVELAQDQVPEDIVPPPPEIPPAPVEVNGAPLEIPPELVEVNGSPPETPPEPVEANNDDEDAPTQPSTTTTTTEGSSSETTESSDPGGCFSVESRPYGNGVVVRNTGNCTCEEARDSENSAHKLGNYRPQCDGEGNYKREQMWSSTGFAWCVDENGNQVSPAVRLFMNVLNC